MTKKRSSSGSTRAKSAKEYEHFGVAVPCRKGVHYMTLRERLAEMKAELEARKNPAPAVREASARPKS